MVSETQRMDSHIFEILENSLEVRGSEVAIGHSVLVGELLDIPSTPYTVPVAKRH